MEKLKPCPFCGGEAKIRERPAFLDESLLIVCTKCGTRQPAILIDHQKIKPEIGPDGACLLDESTRYNRAQAARVAAEKWNRRIYENQADSRADKETEMG